MSSEGFTYLNYTEEPLVPNKIKIKVRHCPSCGARCGFNFSDEPNPLCYGEIQAIDEDEEGWIHRCQYHARLENEKDLPIYPEDYDKSNYEVE